jgi:large subunit ribosomal protein L10
MQLAEKKEFIADFTKELKNAKSIILTQYQGLDVISITKLRKQLKEVDSTMMVIKNRLALRAIEESGIESYGSIKEFFKGPVAVIVGNDDPTRAIKIFKDFAAENKLMEFKAAVIMDRFMDSSQVEKLADMPPKEVLIAQTVMMLNAPIQGFYNSLTGILRKFCYAVNDLKDKMEKGEIAAPAPLSEETPAAEQSEEKAAVEQAEVKEEAAQASEEASAEEQVEETSEAKSEEGKAEEKEEDNNTEEEPKKQEE